MSNLYSGDKPVGAVVISYDTESTPTEGSEKALSSGGAFETLSGKADLVDGKVPESQLPEMYNKEEILTNNTKMLLNLNQNAVPDDAFAIITNQLRLVTGGISSITITLIDTDGNPVTGTEVTNVVTADGLPAVSDDSGVLTGYVPEGTVELAVKDYFNLEDYSETIEVIRGNTITKTFTLTRKDEAEITASCSKRFNGDVADFDICAVGGGGGGGAGEYASGVGNYGGGGGGGGYVENVLAVAAEIGVMYESVVGAGGRGGDSEGNGYGYRIGVSGGTTSISANGTALATAEGGSFGGCQYDSSRKNNGGDGNGPGGYGAAGSTRDATAGTDATGYKFNDESLGLAGGGGGGGGDKGSTLSGSIDAVAGGAPYGGQGSARTVSGTRPAGEHATGYGGGGGGGAGTPTSGTPGDGGKGYQGVIFLRWRYKTI